MSGPFSTFKLLWDFAWLRMRKGRELAKSDERASMQGFWMWIMILIFEFILYSVAGLMYRFANAGPVAAATVLPPTPAEVTGLFLLMGSAAGLMTGLAQTNDVLYGRSDLGWMMALPLHRSGVVYARVAETGLTVGGLVALFALPASLAYAAVFGAWYAVPLSAVFVLSLTVLVSAAAVLVAAFLGRWASSTRAREIMGLIGSLIGALLYMRVMTARSLELSLPESIAQGLSRILGSPAAGVAALFAAPVLWPAAVLHLLAEGRFAAGALSLAGGTCASLAAGLGMAAAVSKVYHRNLARYAGPGRGTRRAVAGRSAATVPAPKQVGVGWALIRRDWAILTRSPRLWQPMAMPLAWIGYVAAMQPLRGIGSLAAAAIGGAMAAVIALSLAQMCFAVEGGAFYHLAVLPLDPRSRVISKVVAFGLPPAVAGLVVTAAIQRGFAGPMGFLWSLGLCFTGAMCGSALGIAMTAAAVNFEAPDPRQWVAPASGMVAGLLLILLGLLAWLVLRCGASLARWMSMPDVFAQTAGVVIVAAVCLGVLVPAAVRRATVVVRARSLSAPIPDW